MKNNVKTIKTIKTNKLATYRKAVITSSLVAILLASSTVSALAAPEGVDTSSMSTVTDIIFWLVRIAIGACTLVPGLLHVAKGHSNEDERMRVKELIYECEENINFWNISKMLQQNDLLWRCNV